jgi:hypothetical protein
MKITGNFESDTGSHEYADRVWDSMGKTLLLLGLGLSLCLTILAATAAGVLRPAIDFPLPVDSYQKIECYARHQVAP